MKWKCPLLPGFMFIALVSSSPTQALPGKCGSIYVELEGFYARFIHDCFQPDPIGCDFQTSESIFDSPPRHNNWEYRIALGYDYLPCNPCYYGLSLEYSHFDSRSHTELLDGNGIMPQGSIFLTPFNQFNNHVRTHFDTADALGHIHRVANACLQGELFGGLRFLRLDKKWSNCFNETPSIVGTDIVFESVLDRHFKNQYEGLGLQAGFKGDYLFYRGFGVTAMTSGCLLLGSQKVTLTTFFTGPTAGFSLFDRCESDQQKDNNHWVPGFSGKLGLTYHACIGCQKLVFEGGYRVDRYFNILREIHIEPTSCGCNQEDLHELSRGSNRDVEFHGPYITLAWHF